ncbi:MAG: hypothetical protein IPJ69_02185 [Deltaproteobacteria bacterium]|nr:MAG: hypothetical protein IPJ69_02185 [Deltaproteobacteria bacterium]
MNDFIRVRRRPIFRQGITLPSQELVDPERPAFPSTSSSESNYAPAYQFRVLGDSRPGLRSLSFFEELSPESITASGLALTAVSQNPYFLGVSLYGLSLMALSDPEADFPYRGPSLEPRVYWSERALSNLSPTRVGQQVYDSLSRWNHDSTQTFPFADFIPTEEILDRIEHHHRFSPQRLENFTYRYSGFVEGLRNYVNAQVYQNPDLDPLIPFMVYLHDHRESGLHSYYIKQDQMIRYYEGRTDGNCVARGRDLVALAQAAGVPFNWRNRHLGYQYFDDHVQLMAYYTNTASPPTHLIDVLLSVHRGQFASLPRIGKYQAPVFHPEIIGLMYLYNHRMNLPFPEWRLLAFVGNGDRPVHIPPRTSSESLVDQLSRGYHYASGPIPTYPFDESVDNLATTPSYGPVENEASHEEDHSTGLKISGVHVLQDTSGFMMDRSVDRRIIINYAISLSRNSDYQIMMAMPSNERLSYLGRLVELDITHGIGNNPLLVRYLERSAYWLHATESERYTMHRQETILDEIIANFPAFEDLRNGEESEGRVINTSRAQRFSSLENLYRNNLTYHALMDRLAGLYIETETNPAHLASQIQHPDQAALAISVYFILPDGSTRDVLRNRNTSLTRWANYLSTVALDSHRPMTRERTVLIPPPIDWESYASDTNVLDTDFDFNETGIHMDPSAFDSPPTLEESNPMNPHILFALYSTLQRKFMTLATYNLAVSLEQNNQDRALTFTRESLEAVKNFDRAIYNRRFEFSPEDRAEIETLHPLFQSDIDKLVAHPELYLEGN